MVKRIKPGPGQESVWDYPRPPRLEACPGETVRIIAAGVEIAKTTRAQRVLETSHPPTYYIPLADTRLDLLIASTHRTWCEWKGQGHYFSLQLPGLPIVEDVAWTYPDPNERFAALRQTLAFYPSRVDECSINGEVVQPQAGDFYGGWITQKIVGPFKGEPGTWGW